MWQIDKVPWPTLLFVALVSVALYVCFLWWMGFFRPIRPTSMRISGAKLVFVEFTGDYRDMTPTINAVKAEFKRFAATKGLSSPAFFGIFYDNPKRLRDKATGRAIVGARFPLNSGDWRKKKGSAVIAPWSSALVDRFVAQSSTGYYTHTHGPIDAIGAHFVFRGITSVVWATFVGWRRIAEFCVKSGMQPQRLFSYEIYDREASHLTIAFPCGPDAETLRLHAAPTPAALTD